VAIGEGDAAREAKYESSQGEEFEHHDPG